MKTSAVIIALTVALAVAGIWKVSEANGRSHAEEAVEMCLDNPSYENIGTLFHQCIADYYFMKGWTR